MRRLDRSMRRLLLNEQRELGKEEALVSLNVEEVEVFCLNLNSLNV